MLRSPVWLRCSTLLPFFTFIGRVDEEMQVLGGKIPGSNHLFCAPPNINKDANMCICCCLYTARGGKISQAFGHIRRQQMLTTLLRQLEGKRIENL